MTAQKCTHKKLQKFATFLNAYYLQKHLVESLNSLHSSRPYGRLLENQKRGGSREPFLPENYFQTSSTKFFLKRHSDFGGLETN